MNNIPQFFKEKILHAGSHHEKMWRQSSAITGSLLSNKQNIVCKVREHKGVFFLLQSHVGFCLRWVKSLLKETI